MKTKHPLITRHSKFRINHKNGKLNKSYLQTFWPSEIPPFVLTLNGWGDSERGWDQTSRNECNLVLQLNFNGFHLQEYNRLVKPNDYYKDGEGPFEYLRHPVCQEQRKIMSWIRMDIDAEYMGRSLYVCRAAFYSR